MIRARGKGKLTTRYNLAVRPRKRAGSTWRCATLDSESSRLKSLDGDWQVPDGPLGLSSELGERDCDRFGPRESFLTSHECRFDSIRPVGFHANRFPSQLITSIRGRNLSTFVDDRWRERGYINSMEEYHLYRRDIYIWRLEGGSMNSLWILEMEEREREIREMFVSWRKVSISIVLRSLCTKSDVMLFSFMHFRMIYIPGEICNVSWKHSSYTGIQERCFEVALKEGKKERV